MIAVKRKTFFVGTCMTLCACCSRLCGACPLLNKPGVSSHSLISRGRAASTKNNNRGCHDR